MTTTTVELVPYDEAIARFDPVIGIEVHVELGTRTKMFDSAPQTFGDEPNTAVSPVSLGLPGALPVVNGTAVEYAIRIGLALNCQIAEQCRFARKNYFYPDVPKNFQTSQYDEPIAFDGYLDVELEDGTVFRVEIERAHMEEDAGKNTHVGGSTGRIHGAEYSLVDYNRAGIPLVEIVTRPITGAGARAPEVARAYVQALRDIFRTLGVSEARMERGNVRADVNLSLRPTPESPLGTRTETKNVNSFRSVDRAVRYEVSRQAAILTAGGTIVQETRHWHEDTGVTTPGRVKSDAEDYRYFPEPDLVPVAPSREWVEEIRASLPELPGDRRRRLTDEWGYSEPEMRDVLNAGALDLIEATVATGATPAAARKWWMGSSPAPPSSVRSSSPSCRSPRRRSASCRHWSTPAGSTTSSPARCSRACSTARGPRRRSSSPAASRSCPTTAPCSPRSTTSWPPSPTSPTASAAASSRPSARSSAGS